MSLFLLLLALYILCPVVELDGTEHTNTHARYFYMYIYIIYIYLRGSQEIRVAELAEPF